MTAGDASAVAAAVAVAVAHRREWAFVLDDRPMTDGPDDRLRLIVTCRHPALDRSAQVALTFRLMCGRSTAEVARACLVSESTMAARITRVHLLFTTGHTTPAGDELVRRALVERAVELGRMVRRLLPRDPAVAGLLALMLLTDARRETRTGPDGRLILLEEQDRTWVDLLGVGLGDDRADRGGDQLRVPSGARRRACRVSGCDAGRQSWWPGWEDGAGGNRWHPPDYFCQPIISGVATKNRPAP